jgi:hypothetical protein
MDRCLINRLKLVTYWFLRTRRSQGWPLPGPLESLGMERTKDTAPAEAVARTMIPGEDGKMEILAKVTESKHKHPARVVVCPTIGIGARRSAASQAPRGGLNRFGMSHISYCVFLNMSIVFGGRLRPPWEPVSTGPDRAFAVRLRTLFVNFISHKTRPSTFDGVVAL